MPRAIEVLAVGQGKNDPAVPLCQGTISEILLVRWHTCFLILAQAQNARTRLNQNPRCGRAEGSHRAEPRAEVSAGTERLSNPKERGARVSKKGTPLA